MGNTAEKSQKITLIKHEGHKRGGNEHNEYFGSIPILMACKHGNLDILRHMLTNEKVNPNVMYMYDHWYNAYQCPIMIACQNKQWEAVKLLLEHNLNVNVQMDDRVRLNSSTPLGETCAAGNYEMVEMLLEAGAIMGNSDKITIFGKRSSVDNDCIFATINPKINTLLFEKGIKFPRNRLERACYHRNIDWLRLCISEGSIPSSDYLERMCEDGKNLEIITLLIKSGTKITEQCLKSALHSKSLKIITLLVNCGATISGDCLICALEYSTHEMVKFLLENGAIVTGKVLSFAAKLTPNETNTALTKMILDYRSAQTNPETGKNVAENSIAVGEPIK